MSKENLTTEERCKHDPFKYNTLIVEAHWAAGVRVRCKLCGETAHVGRRGGVKPDRQNERNRETFGVSLMKEHAE